MSAPLATPASSTTPRVHRCQRPSGRKIRGCMLMRSMLKAKRRRARVVNQLEKKTSLLVQRRVAFLFVSQMDPAAMLTGRRCKLASISSPRIATTQPVVSYVSSVRDAPARAVLRWLVRGRCELVPIRNVICSPAAADCDTLASSLPAVRARLRADHDGQSPRSSSSSARLQSGQIRHE